MIAGSGGAVEDSPIEKSLALTRLYQPIVEEMKALRDHLHDEFASSEPFVNELLEHLAKFRGKQIRPACVFLAGKCFGETHSDHIRCAAVVELIHTATLVHDDLLDQADIRRRVDTVHSRYGDRAAILLGDIIYARGFVISTEVEGAAKQLAECTREICIGEMLQVGSAGDLNLSEEQYFQIIHRKTAILYGLSCRLGATLSGASDEQADALERFGILLGTAFQIADDALDLVGDQETVGKSLGTDLVNGKMTLPLILLRDQLDDEGRESLMQLLEAAAAGQSDDAAHAKLLKWFEQEGILERVQQRASDSIDGALDALRDASGPGPARERLEELARFVVRREL
ncbi:MAG: polyprenyl synthetase family protein [Planctomycetes bacterium]|mgnify:CR=1 FL=1|nr:polyprenyl synthetase family protein [Planctomycetota bacterium]MBT6452998.1 polyprenyl synthetase family protein [Planctomycetota bacterium]MBT6541837.1 polyprenyl synthetase family protein [Planctomycetota bacterium]MBT6783502.1 polyprenyl synthetase family protein [Planctomycetota bacterium]MBT6968842.1 polyprenyl synthetase family protein [Planctomycetota bacterium]